MTNVPQITFTANGPSAPSESAILAGVQQDVNAAFGSNLNPDPTTPQGQIAVSTAAIVGNSNNQFLSLAAQFDPAFAVGRFQDGLARIYFLTRDPALPTVLQCQCNGAPGLDIPAGSQIQDSSQNTYTSTQDGVIGAGGTVIIPFACVTPGPVPVPQPNTVSIFQAITGWDSVSVVSGVAGVNVESASAFETRRQATVQANSVGSLPSIRGAVLKVPGITDAYVTENTSNGSTTVGGVSLNPNSVYVCVGGSASGTAIAQAIWTKKIPGCSYTGTTTVVVQDQSPGYTAPFPSYNVSYQQAQGLPIFFAVNIVSSTGVPANATTLIQNALLNAFAGGDNGPRATIGSLILATRYGGPQGPIGSLGNWAQIRSINLGSQNNSTATVTGSISGSTLTITAIQAGGNSIAAGQSLVSGTNNSGTASVLPGTTIITQLTGSAGGTGTYSVTNSQVVLSGPMQLVTVNSASVQVNINQLPELFTANIAVTVT